MLLQPAMAARNDKTIMQALWIAAPLNGLFGVFAVILGLTAKSVPEFNVVGQKVATTSMLIAYLPGWLSALLLASFLAAILSTFAMISLAVATIFAHDIYRALYRPTAREKEMTLVIRAVIVIVAGIATGVASFLPPILAAMNWLFAWLVPVFWIVIFGLFCRCSQAVAITTLLACWFVNCLWSFTELPVHLGVARIPNAIVTIVTALLFIFVGNALIKGSAGYLSRIKNDQPLTNEA